ncbi:MAG: hypothetical protein ACK5L3_07930, partial [Oscillospiraceae bacterium]
AHWFTEDRLANPEVLKLASKFEAFGEKTTPWNHFAVFKKGSFPEMTVEIHLNDGTVLSKTGAFPKGHPQNNTTLEEEFELFRSITAPYLEKQKAEAVIAEINNLENLENLQKIAGSIAG